MGWHSRRAERCRQTHVIGVFNRERAQVCDGPAHSERRRVMFDLHEADSRRAEGGTNFAAPSSASASVPSTSHFTKSVSREAPDANVLSLTARTSASPSRLRWSAPLF